MKRLFEKNEVLFAIILIVIYVIGSNIAQGLSEAVGTEFLCEAILNVALSAFLIIFIKNNGLMRYIGLCRPKVSAAKMWLYIPLLLIAARGIVYGIGSEYSFASLVLRTVSMLFVGFIEEVIFRGFLFRGIARKSLNRAIIISAVTFGIGHIVNLLNGYDIADNIIQIVYAIGCGFMLVMIFVRTGSIVPCIAFHSLNNMLTGFVSAERLINAVGERNAELINLAVGLIFILIYTIYVVKFVPEQHIDEE